MAPEGGPDAAPGPAPAGAGPTNGIGSPISAAIGTAISTATATGARPAVRAPRRLLIVKTSSMGDVVHAMPAISDIAAHCPGTEIDWLVERPFDAIVRLHPAVTQVQVLAWRRWRKRLGQRATWAEMGALRQALRGRHYDAVLDLQGLFKSVLWARQAGVPVSGYDRASAREPLASLFYARRAAVPVAWHAIERCRRLAAAHLGYAVPAGAALPPPDFGLRAPPPGWAPPAGAYAVLNPNASSDDKLWPQAQWIALAQALRAHGLALVVMWGSPAEEARAREIAQAAGGVLPPFLTLGDAAAVLAAARLVVGLDTGFSHLAAALGAPTVGLYCDHHDPAQVGITGQGYARSLGGRGQPPGLQAVLQAAFGALLPA